MVDLCFFVRERRKLGDKGIELEQAHLILIAQESMHKAFGGLLLDATVFEGAGAGVDGQGEVERQFGLTFEDGDLLRTVVFGDGKVVARQSPDDCAVGVGHVDEDTHKLDVDVQRQVVLGDEGLEVQEQKRGQAS